MSKIIKKIIVLTFIQISFISNCVFALELRSETGQEIMLAPQLVLTQPQLRDAVGNARSFDKAVYDFFMEYDQSGFVYRNGGLDLKGAALVEMAMLVHELGNDIMPITEAAMSVLSSEIRQTADQEYTDTMSAVSNALNGVNAYLVDLIERGEVPNSHSVVVFIAKARRITGFIPDLLKIKKNKRLAPELALKADKALSCIDEISSRVDVMLFGVKESEFKIEDCLRTELRWKAVNGDLRDIPPLSGYKGGLDYVIKNIRYNVMAHSGKAVKKGYLNVAFEGDALVMVFADKGYGFDIEELRQKAVDLGFWDKKTAAVADEKQVIDLIFEKGFSRRYERGKAHGLGLWLCRNIINKYYNGTITAANELEGTGAVFTVRIPLREKNGLLSRVEGADKKSLSPDDIKSDIVKNGTAGLLGNIQDIAGSSI